MPVTGKVSKANAMILSIESKIFILMGSNSFMVQYLGEFIYGFSLLE